MTRLPTLSAMRRREAALHSEIPLRSERAREKRRVVFFHPRFADGGVERTNIQLGRELVRRGYEVEFLTTVATDHYVEELSAAGIELLQMGRRRTLATLPSLCRELLRRAQTVDLLYCVSCQYYVNVVALIAAKIVRRYRQNVQFLVSERNHPDEFTYRDDFKSKVVLTLVRQLYSTADTILANSEELAMDLHSLVGEPVVTVYNPTINERLRQLSKGRVEESWFIRDERPCVLWVGRLAMQKDPLTAVKSFQYLRDLVDAKLVILGEGPLRSELEELIKRLGIEDSIYLPGFVRNPYRFMAQADAFLLSSRYEGLPNVLIEAAYTGLACVSTRCRSGPAEILLQGRGGWLVPVGDARLMAHALKQALTDADEKKSRIQAAREGLYRFRSERVVADFMRLLE